MTVFTPSVTGIALGESSRAAPVSRPRHAPLKREYYAYFAIIFLATIPLASLTWLLGALRKMEWPEKGPMARAWTQARIITPHIFSA